MPFYHHLWCSFTCSRLFTEGLGYSQHFGYHYHFYYYCHSIIIIIVVIITASSRMCQTYLASSAFRSLISCSISSMRRSCFSCRLCSFFSAIVCISLSCSFRTLLTGVKPRQSKTLSHSAGHQHP